MGSRTFIIRVDGRIDLVEPTFSDRLHRSPYKTVSYTRRPPCLVQTARGGSKALAALPRYCNGGPAIVDVSESARGPGLLLAPSPALGAWLRAARSWGPTMIEQARAQFLLDYRLEMRDSYMKHRPVWLALMAQPRVVLHCECVDTSWCHRDALGRILRRLGAQYEGELT